MIQIIREMPAPAILSKAGITSRDKAIREFGSNRAKFLKNWAANSEIYGHVTVKESLIKSQHGKCCYCESKVTHVCYGDVEHYRPKAGYRETEFGPLITPGYFWLAYDWENLLFSCEICNRRYKKNLFPLEIVANRVRTPLSDISSETPLLIDPGKENPETYISYRGDTPFAVNGNSRGEATITMVGLRNETLRSRRASILSTLRIMHEITSRSPDDAKKWECQQILSDASKPESEYSAAVKNAIATDFKYV